jgi:hypothetical protein
MPAIRITNPIKTFLLAPCLEAVGELLQLQPQDSRNFEFRGKPVVMGNRIFRHHRPLRGALPTEGLIQVVTGISSVEAGLIFLRRQLEDLETGAGKAGYTPLLPSMIHAIFTMLDVHSNYPPPKSRELCIF